MRPGCCGPKRHGDMHANFSFLLQPYRPPSAAGPSTQEKHCCWERMVLCSAPTDCSPVRGGMPGSPAAAGFPAGDVLGDALAEGWLQTSPPSPRRRHKPWRQTLGEHSRCGGRSSPSGLQLCKYPRRSAQKCSLMQFWRAWVLLQQVSSGRIPWPGGHSPPTPPKTLETCRFFVVCMWVKTGKQYRPKTDKCPGSEGGEEAAGISSEMLC